MENKHQSAEIKGIIPSLASKEDSIASFYSHLKLGHWLSSLIDSTMANGLCIGLLENLLLACSPLVLIGLSVQERSIGLAVQEISKL